MPASHLTRSKADAHEALYPKLDALTRQVEALSLRHPTAPVSPALRATAETLLYTMQPFLPVRRSLPPAAADLAGLATQLIQARAALDVFESANSAWHPDLKCRVWSLSGDPVPVRRLRPESNVLIKSAKEKRYFTGIREKLLRRIDAKAEEAYEQGYEDARLNKPMRESRL